jgi:hypothetical protein
MIATDEPEKRLLYALIASANQQGRLRRGQALHIQRIAFIPFNPDDFWYVLKDMGLYGETVDRTGEDEVDPAGYDWRIVGFEAVTDEMRSEAR